MREAALTNRAGQRLRAEQLDADGAPHRVEGRAGRASARSGLRAEKKAKLSGRRRRPQHCCAAVPILVDFRRLLLPFNANFLRLNILRAFEEARRRPVFRIRRGGRY